MILWILRGISKVTAAITGLLVAYSFIYTIAAMTTRIPTIPRELSVTTFWMLPWMLLFCSGVEDFGTVTRQAWVFWVGVGVGLAPLYYFENYTSDRILTKAAMPLLATGRRLAASRRSTHKDRVHSCITWGWTRRSRRSMSRFNHSPKSLVCHQRHWNCGHDFRDGISSCCTSLGSSPPAIPSRDSANSYCFPLALASRQAQLRIDTFAR
jgi:hypothetical protein